MARSKAVKPESKSEAKSKLAAQAVPPEFAGMDERDMNLPLTWEPEPGDALKGVLVARDTPRDKKGREFVVNVLQVHDGTRYGLVGAQLTRALAEVPFQTEVGVQFLGKDDLDADRTMNRYRLFVTRKAAR